MAPPSEHEENFANGIAPIFVDFMALLKHETPQERISPAEEREQMLNCMERLRLCMVEFNSAFFAYHLTLLDSGREDFFAIGFMFPRYQGEFSWTMSGEAFWNNLLIIINEIIQIPPTSEEERYRTYRQTCMDMLCLLMRTVKINFFMAAIEGEIIYYFVFSQDGTLSYSSRSILEPLFSPKDIEFLNKLPPGP